MQNIFKHVQYPANSKSICHICRKPISNGSTMDATASSVVHMQPRNASHLQNDPDFSSLASYHHLPTRNTVDGRNPAPVDRWFIHVYPTISKISTIQGGAGGFPARVDDFPPPSQPSSPRIEGGKPPSPRRIAWWMESQQ